MFASCGDCGQSRVKEDHSKQASEQARPTDGRTREGDRGTNRATKLRHVEWEMDAAAAAAAAVPKAKEGGRERAKAMEGGRVVAYAF